MSYYSEVLSDSPGLFLLGTDTTGTSLVDSSGNSHNAALNGGYTLAHRDAPVGIGGKAVLFNGTTGYGGVADHADLDLGDGPLSMEAWVWMPTGTTGNRMIFAKFDGGYGLFSEDDGNVILFRSQVAYLVGATAPFSKDAWHHIVATKDGATMTIWLNGANVTGGGSDSTCVDTATALGIGSETGTGWNDGWSGNLCGLAIYPSALTSTQIKAHYAAGLGGYRGEVLADFPLLAASLDETSGTNLDTADGGSDGTATDGDGSYTLAQAGPITSEAVNNSIALEGGGWLSFPSRTLTNADILTLEIWYQRTGGDGSNRKLFWQSAGSDGWELSHRSDNKLHFGRATIGYSIDGKTAITDSDWHCIQVVKSTTTIQKIYLDGVDDTNSTATVANTASTDDIAIGSDHGSGEAITGNVARPALYDGALSKARLDAHRLAAPTTKTLNEEITADEPVAHWRMNETSGTTADNCEGTATYDGTYVDTPTLGATGATGDADTAITLNGSSEYVSVPYNAALQPAAWSFEVLVKWSSLTDPWDCIAAMDSYTADTGWLIYWTGTALVFACGQSEYCQEDISSPGTSDWHHLVATYDGTYQRLYWDGSEIAWDDRGTIVTNTQSLLIGCRYGNDGTGTDDFLPGSFDEAAFYNSVLSPGRVASHYAAIINDVAPEGVDAKAVIKKTISSTPASKAVLKKTASSSFASKAELFNAPSVRSVSSATVRNAGTTGLTINKPANIANRDILYAFIGCGDDGGGAFDCSGWTALASNATTSGNDIGSTVLRKFITNAAGEPASYTFTNTNESSYNKAGFIVCVKHGNNVNFEDATTTKSTGTNDFTPNNVDITTVTNNALLLACHISNHGTNSAKTGGAPSEFTLVDTIKESRDTGNYCACEVAYKKTGAFGAQSIGNWTGSPDNATEEWHTYAVAIRPRVLPETLSGSVVSRSILKKIFGVTPTSKAVIKKTAIGSIVTKSIIQKTSAFTPVSRSVLKKTASSGFDSKSILAANIATYSADFVSSAVLKKTFSFSFSSKAILKKIGSGNFDIKSVLSKNIPDTVDGKSILGKTLTASPVGKAVLAKTTAPTFNSKSIFRKVFEPSVSSKSVVQKSLSSDIASTAVVQKTVDISFDAKSRLIVFSINAVEFASSAVISKTSDSSFGAKSYLIASTEQTIDSKSILQKTSSSDYSSKAVIRKVFSEPISASAVVQRQYLTNINAKAIIKKSLTPTLSAHSHLYMQPLALYANAVLKDTQSYSLSSSSILFKAIGEAISSKAVISAVSIETFAAKSVLSKQTSTNFASKAIIKKIFSNGFTSQAVIEKSYLFGIESKAAFKKTFEPSLVSLAVINKTLIHTFNAKSITQKTLIPTVESKSVIEKTTEKVLVSSARLVAPSIGSAEFAALAVLNKTQDNAFSASAHLHMQPVSLSSKAVIKRAQASTFATKAIIQKTVSFDLVTQSILQKTAAQTFSANATLKRPQTAPFDAKALLLKVSTPTFNSKSVVKGTWAKTATSKSVVKRSFEGQVGAKSYLVVAGSPTSTLDSRAVLKKTITGSFASKSYIRKVTERTFSGKSVLEKTIADSLSARAVLGKTSTGSVGAIAVLWRVENINLVSRAVLQKSLINSLSVKSVIQKTNIDDLLAQAVIRKINEQVFLSSAVLRRTDTIQVVASGVIKATRQSVLGAKSYLLHPQETVKTLEARAVIKKALVDQFSAKTVFKKTITPQIDSVALILKRNEASFASKTFIVAVLHHGRVWVEDDTPYSVEIEDSLQVTLSESSAEVILEDAPICEVQDSTGAEVLLWESSQNTTWGQA